MEDSTGNLRAGGGKAAACSRDLGPMHQRLHQGWRHLAHNCLSQLFHSYICSSNTHMLGSNSFGSINISIAIPNIMVDSFWNPQLTSWKLTSGMTLVRTCLEICGTAVKCYLENASSKCPGGHYLEYLGWAGMSLSVQIPQSSGHCDSPTNIKQAQFNTLREGGSAGNNHTLLYTQQKTASRV